MIPSPRVGSGVDVRQTGEREKKFRYFHDNLVRGNILSTFWKVKIPSLSNWVPLEVTVKFSVMAAHDPGGPQSVGGLEKNGSLVASSKGRFPGKDSHSS